MNNSSTRTDNISSILSTNELMNNDKINLRFVVTNARSLTPNLESLYDSIDELDLGFVVITESWLTKGEELQQLERDLDSGHGPSIITRCRPKQSGRNPGGGVAIISRKRNIKITEYSCKRGRHEILVGKAKLVNNTNPIFIIAVYVPPKTRTSTIDELNQTLADIISKIKTEVANPYIIVCGDFNRFNINQAYNDYMDMQPLTTPPSRKGACLDKCVTNFNEEILDVQVHEPLTTDQGLQSDHDMLLFLCSLKHTHAFEKIRYSTREVNKERKDEFNKKFAIVDWLTIATNEADPSKLTEIFQAKVIELDNGSFWEIIC